jgi:regulator of protease activity HflC (stomatin/prohibitin superfamily)
MCIINAVLHINPAGRDPAARVEVQEMSLLFPSLVVLVAIAAGLAVLSIFIVEQQTAAVVQRFGRFLRVAGPGLHAIVPIIDRVAGRVNLRVSQLDVEVETKTEDNVFVRVVVAVQYRVLPDKIYAASYELAEVRGQITSFVFDVVRARVPRLKLDELFERKDEIADAVASELSQTMGDFGHGIVKALVTDIDPDARVKTAMNEINAAQRERVAASERGEADRILKVKAAEAEAQSKALQGKGIADQRREIISGLRESVDEFSQSVPGATAHDVMALILMTQYFDTLKEIGAANHSSSILLPHSPGFLTDLAGQIRSAIISGQAVTDAAQKANGGPGALHDA